MSQTYFFDKTKPLMFDPGKIYKTTCILKINSTPVTGVVSDWSQLSIKIGLIGFTDENTSNMASRVYYNGQGTTYPDISDTNIYTDCFFHVFHQDASNAKIEKDKWLVLDGYTSNYNATPGQVVAGTNVSATIENPGRIYTDSASGARSTRYIVPVVVIQNTTGRTLNIQIDSLAVEIVDTYISANQFKTGTLAATEALYIGGQKQISLDGVNNVISIYSSAGRDTGQELVTMGKLTGNSGYGLKINNSAGQRVFQVDESGTAIIDNISMGPGGTISWGSVLSSGGTNLGAYLTKITSSGLYTGTIMAEAITGGSLTIGLPVAGSGAIRSSNYSAGASGWQIKADGTAELNNAVIRGDIYMSLGSKIAWGNFDTDAQSRTNNTNIKAEYGRNLLSQATKYGTEWYSTSATVQLGARYNNSDYGLSKYYLYAYSNWSSSFGGYWWGQKPMWGGLTLEPNTDYILSYCITGVNPNTTQATLTIQDLSNVTVISTIAYFSSAASSTPASGFRWQFTTPNDASRYRKLYFATQQLGNHLPTSFNLYDVKLEKGAASTPWTLPPEDSLSVITSVQATASQGVTLASIASSAASAAQASANQANSKLSEISSDSIITQSEKPALFMEWKAIYDEYDDIIAKATQLNVDFAPYVDANTYLYLYLVTGPLAMDGVPTDGAVWIADPNSITIDPLYFRSIFASLYSTRQALLNAIAEKASTMAVWSSVSGSGRPEDFATSNRYMGAWSSASIVHRVGDEVLYGGSTYSALVAHTSTVGNGPPTPPTIANTFWSLKTATGVSAISAILSNETHTISCSATGAPLSYAYSGTDISVWEGSTELQYDGVGSANGTYNVSASGINIAPGAKTDAGQYASYGVASGMNVAIDQAVISYTITGKNSQGTSFTITKNQTFSKSKTGIQGIDGVIGYNARYVDLSAVAQVFSYNASGNNPSPASSIVTATSYGTSGTPYYEFLVKDVSVQNTTTNTITYTPSVAFASMPAKIEVRVREGANNNPVVATDIMTMIGIRPGLDGAVGATGASGANGANALTTAVVELYSNSTSAVPSGVSQTYTFSTNVLTGTFTGWSQTMPVTTTSPTYMTTCAFSATAPTDFQTKNGVWSTPVIVAQNGASGANGVNGQSTYTATVFLQTGSAPAAPSGGNYNFQTGVLTPPTSPVTWYVSQPPSTTTPTYACSYTFTGLPSVTVSAGTWTNVRVDAQVGAIGATGASGLNGTRTAVLDLYQWATSQPSAPTGSSTYTWATAQFDTGGVTLGSWTTVPAASPPLGTTLWICRAVYADSNTTATSSVSWAGSTVRAAGAAGNMGLNWGDAKSLFLDPTFLTGNNGIGVYNNAPQAGTVTHERLTLSSSEASASPYYPASSNVLRISSWAGSGTPSPGCGGFYQPFVGRPSAVFVQRIVAKIPVGYTVQQATNPIGDGATNIWLTDQAGTGTWKEYILKRTCGPTGQYSMSGHMYIVGSQGTSGSPVVWDLAFAAVYDFSSLGSLPCYISVNGPSLAFTRSEASNSFAPASITLTMTPFNGVATNIRWYKNGSVIAGQTNTTLAVLNSDSASAATYRATATMNGVDVSDESTVIWVTGGSNPIYGYLTNPSTVLNTDLNGNGYNLALTSGVFKVFQGTTDVTSLATYGAPSVTNCTMSTPSSGNYVLSSLTASSAKAVLSATYLGVTVSGALTVAKSPAGATGSTGASGAPGASGANGQRVGLLEVYKWSAANPSASPPSGTSTYTWSNGTFTAPSTPNGWSLLPGAAVLGQTLWGFSTIVSDNLTTATSTATWSGSATYPVGYAGSDGASGANAITGVLSNESHGIPADALGNATTFAGASTTMSVFVGATDDSANWTYNTVKTNLTCSEAATSRTQTVTAMPASASIGYLDITATKAAATITKRFTVVKSIAGSAGLNGATGASGANAVTYWMVSSAAAIQRNIAGAFTPSSITVYGYSATGASLPTLCLGKFKIYENGSLSGTSAAPEHTKTWAINPGTTVFKVEYFTSDLLTKLDEQTMPVVFDGNTGSTGASGANGTNGINGLTAILSNETHSVPCNTAGDPLSYDFSGTTIRVFDGATELTYDGVGTTASKWTIGTPFYQSIISGSITSTPPYATVGVASGLGADSAMVSYPISGRTIGNVPFTFVKTQTFSKSKQGNIGNTGASGAPGPAFMLTSNKHAFTSTDGLLDAGQTDITFTALKQNVTGTVTWSSIPSSAVSGTGDTKTLTAANFGANKFITVSASAGGLSDTITISRLEKSTAASGATKNTAYSQPSSSAPSNPQAGDTWFKTDINTSYTYNGSVWYQSSPYGTQISATGIYTGTVNANQINSGAIRIKDDAIVGVPVSAAPQGTIVGNTLGDPYINVDGTANGWSRLWHQKIDTYFEKKMSTVVGVTNWHNVEDLTVGNWGSYVAEWKGIVYQPSLGRFWHLIRETGTGVNRRIYYSNGIHSVKSANYIDNPAGGIWETNCDMLDIGVTSVYGHIVVCGGRKWDEYGTTTLNVMMYQDPYGQFWYTWINLSFQFTPVAGRNDAYIERVGVSNNNYNPNGATRGDREANIRWLAVGCGRVYRSTNATPMAPTDWVHQPGYPAILAQSVINSVDHGHDNTWIISASPFYRSDKSNPLGSLFRSTDNGATFVDVTPAIVSETASGYGHQFYGALYDSITGYWWVVGKYRCASGATTPGDNMWLWRSTDDGATWQKYYSIRDNCVGAKVTSYYWLSTNVSKKDDILLMAICDNSTSYPNNQYVVVSSDGGVTWTAKASNSQIGGYDIPKLYPHPNYKGFILTGDGSTAYNRSNVLY